MSSSTNLLTEADRCMLAARGPAEPLLSPMAFWWDGAGLWMTAPADSAAAASLREAPVCSAWVPPARAGEPGAVLRGSARVFGLHDPFAMALHWPAISGALLALATRNAAQLVGYVQDAPRLALRRWPRNRVVVRVGIERLRGVDPPEPGPGMAPPLPTAVPPAVRRSLGGERRVAVAFQHDGELGVVPAAWDSGYALRFPVGLAPPPGARLAAAVHADPQQRPTQAVGVVVHGAHDGARLVPDRVTWWEGVELGSADVDLGPSARGIELPD